MKNLENNNKGVSNKIMKKTVQRLKIAWDGCQNIIKDEDLLAKKALKKIENRIEKITKEITRIKKFQSSVLGTKQEIEIKEVDIKNFAKFILKDGEIHEKRELLECLEGKIILEDKVLRLINQ